MKYTIEKKNDVVLIELKANLEGGPDTFEIKDEVKGQIAAGERKFVLDMEKVGFVSSTGIGVVVGIYSSIKKAEGELKVSGVSDRARRSFVVTGVWDLFSVYDNRKEALAAFGA